MYLNTKTHPVDDAKRVNSILMAQTLGWLYESHCWVHDPETNDKTCMWCEAKSQVDQQVDELPAPNLCPKNPVLTVFLTEHAGDGIDEHQQALNRLKERDAAEGEEGDTDESG